MSTIIEDLKILGENLERLKVENNLLRAASKEQRELNGELRQTINTNTTTLTLWVNWFNIWSSLIDGSCYSEGVDLVNKSREVLNDRT